MNSPMATSRMAEPNIVHSSRFSNETRGSEPVRLTPGNYASNTARRLRLCFVTLVANRPLCFVLMPFGRKPDGVGRVIDFDAVYRDLISPAIASADLEPIRADEEMAGGIVHKPMFERLILCEYAVADLTLANANVFYELGVRHAFKPYSTVQIIAEGQRLPFDVQMLRTIPYRLSKDGIPEAAVIATAKAGLVTFLNQARKAIKDSPIYTLIDSVQAPFVDHQKTDSFRDQVRSSNQIKENLAEARRQGAGAVKIVESGLGKIDD